VRTIGKSASLLGKERTSLYSFSTALLNLGQLSLPEGNSQENSSFFILEEAKQHVQTRPNVSAGVAFSNSIRVPGEHLPVTSG
jgi:hypothetical protein